jgi:hypothetical protein
MATYKDHQFSNEPVELDGNKFEGCTFAKCKLVYRGSTPPGLSRCRFDDCSWEFDDAAGRTVAFLRGLYHGMGDAGRRLVEETFRLPPGKHPPARGGPRPA